MLYFNALCGLNNAYTVKIKYEILNCYDWGSDIMKGNVCIVGIVGKKF